MRPITLGLILLTLAFAPALVGGVLAAPGANQDRPPVLERVLTEAERILLEEHLGREGAPERAERGGPPAGVGAGGRGRSDDLPPGLAKRESLPPGIARRLEQGGTLPPGLEGRALPDDLERRLPRREGTRRVIVDDDVVLIEDGTRRILDILRGPAARQ